MEKAKMETEKSKESSNGERRPYQCGKCISSFKSYMELKFHDQSAHGGKDGLKCYICETVFKKSCKLQKHHRSNQNSLACTIFTFTWHQSMKKEI